MPRPYVLRTRPLCTAPYPPVQALKFETKANDANQRYTGLQPRQLYQRYYTRLEDAFRELVEKDQTWVTCTWDPTRDARGLINYTNAQELNLMI